MVVYILPDIQECTIPVISSDFDSVIVNGKLGKYATVHVGGKVGGDGKMGILVRPRHCRVLLSKVLPRGLEFIRCNISESL
jgi:hypothetical protein